MSQIVVSKNAGVMDTIYAALRYFLVVAGAVPLLLKMLGEHRFADLVAYFQSADGTALVGAVVALGSLIVGLIKTFRRGDQVASVAANPKVPTSVATTK